jgi:hypothetical protein
VPPYD